MKVKNVFIVILFFLLGLAIYMRNIPTPKIPTPPPKTRTPFVSYTAPKIPKKSQYLLVMLGDSMTLALGPHGGSFNQFLNDKYKTVQSFVEIDNYARASTNVLSLN